MPPADQQNAPPSSTAPAWLRPSPATCRLVVGLVLGGLTLFRLWYAGTLPLSEDEANSWQWSRHLDWGYFDQGPMIAWTVRAGTILLGDSETGVRLWAVLLGLGISWLIYDFCRRVLDDEPLGMWLVLAANGAVLFAVGAVVHTYDTPQAFFWMATLYGLGLALFKGRRWGWWLAGVALGLACLAKYSSALLPCMFLGYLLATPGQRHWLGRKEPWLALGLAALVFSPNLWWNANHLWSAFLWTATRVEPLWKFTNFEYLGGQFGLMGPVLTGMMVVAWWKGWRRARRGDQVIGFLLWTSIPVLVFFFIVSTKSRVQANWPAPAYLAGLLAAGAAAMPELMASRAWRRWGAAALVSGWALVLVALAHAPILAALELDPKYNPFKKIHGWRQLTPAFARVLDNWPGPEKPFIFGTRYQYASLSAFYAPGQPRTEGLFLPDARLNAYVFWTDPRALKGREGLALVGGEPDLTYLFERTEELAKVDLTGPSGRVIHRLKLIRGINFKGRDARPPQFLEALD